MKNREMRISAHVRPVHGLSVNLGQVAPYARAGDWWGKIKPWAIGLGIFAASFWLLCAVLVGVIWTKTLSGVADVQRQIRQVEATNGYMQRSAPLTPQQGKAVQSRISEAVQNAKGEQRLQDMEQQIRDFDTVHSPQARKLAAETPAAGNPKRPTKRRGYTLLDWGL